MPLSESRQQHLLRIGQKEWKAAPQISQDRIDKAVTRPGRMLAYREFKRLTPTQAQKLAAAKKLQIKPQESYSLAEIYDAGNSQMEEIQKRGIGFLG